MFLYFASSSLGWLGVLDYFNLGELEIEKKNHDAKFYFVVTI